MEDRQELRCAVIDDEPLARSLIASYIDKTRGLKLCDQYGVASDAAGPISEGKYDLLLLDIDMPGLNGIELGKLVPASTRIIYITAYDRFALEGYRVNALDYLLKPVSYEEFMRAVTKAFEWKAMISALHDRAEYVAEASERATDCITVKSEYRLVRIRLSTVLYVEVKGDKVIFYRTEGLVPVATLMSMREIETQLPGDRFMRVHRSFIVNIDKVEVVERGRILFGRTAVPVSETYRDIFLRRLEG